MAYKYLINYNEAPETNYLRYSFLVSRLNIRFLSRSCDHAQVKQSESRKPVLAPTLKNTVISSCRHVQGIHSPAVMDFLLVKETPQCTFELERHASINTKGKKSVLQLDG